jgi:N-methylhydantoinase A
VASSSAFETSGTRSVSDAAGSANEVPVVEVARQQRGAEGEGPLVVEGPFFTMLVPPAWRLKVSGSGDLILTDTSATKENR